jgi:hypothetical protein
MTLFSTVLPVVRHCSKSARQRTRPNEFIEIECRVYLRPEEFFATVQLLSTHPSFTFINSTKQRDAVFATRQKHDARKVRITFPVDNDVPLFTIEKHDMLTNGRLSVSVGEFDVKVSVERECYQKPRAIHAEVKPLFWREKDRRTFVCMGLAPDWHVDLTHVIKYMNSVDEPNARVTYELEFELQQRGLLTEEPDALAHQLENVIHLILSPS